MSCSNLTWWFIHNRCLFIELLIQLSSPKPALQISWDIQWCGPTCLLHCKFDVVDETSTPQLLRYETHPWQNMSWMALKGLITVCGFLLVRKCCMRERGGRKILESHVSVYITWFGWHESYCRRKGGTSWYVWAYMSAFTVPTCVWSRLKWLKGNAAGALHICDGKSWLWEIKCTHSLSRPSRKGC